LLLIDFHDFTPCLFAMPRWRHFICHRFDYAADISPLPRDAMRDAAICFTISSPPSLSFLRMMPRRASRDDACFHDTPPIDISAPSARRACRCRRRQRCQRHITRHYCCRHFSSPHFRWRRHATRASAFAATLTPLSIALMRCRYAHFDVMLFERRRHFSRRFLRRYATLFRYFCH
jgi:hypothetical protein